MLPDFGATRFVRDIRCRNLFSRKSVPKFTKIGDDLLRTNAPHHAKFHRAPSNDVGEKRYHFLPFIILAPQGQGDPCAKVHYSG